MTPSRISMAREIVGVVIPRRRPGQDGFDVRQQRLADLPGRRVPQVGRTVVHGVIVHAVRHLDDRLGKRGRSCPAETHAGVTRDVDDQAPGSERRQILLGDENQRCVGILKDAVDDDVVVGEEARHRDRPVRQIRPGPFRRIRVLSHLDDLRGVNRRRDRGHVSVGQHAHIVDAVGVQYGDRAAGGGAESDDGSPQPTTVAAGDSRPVAWRAGRSSSPRAHCSCERRAGRTRRRAPSDSSPRRRLSSSAGRWRSASGPNSARSVAIPRRSVPPGIPRDPRPGPWVAG